MRNIQENTEKMWAVIEKWGVKTTLRPNDTNVTTNHGNKAQIAANVLIIHIKIPDPAVMGVFVTTIPLQP